MKIKKILRVLVICIFYNILKFILDMNGYDYKVDITSGLLLGLIIVLLFKKSIFKRET